MPQDLIHQLRNWEPGFGSALPELRAVIIEEFQAADGNGEKDALRQIYTAVMDNVESHASPAERAEMRAIRSRDTKVLGLGLDTTGVRPSGSVDGCRSAARASIPGRSRQLLTGFVSALGGMRRMIRGH